MYFDKMIFRHFVTWWKNKMAYTYLMSVVVKTSVKGNQKTYGCYGN